MKISITSRTRSPDAPRLAASVSERVAQVLAEVSDRITRADIDLSDDEFASEGAVELRCAIEAHSHGRDPVVVAYRASSAESAVAGALNTLQRVIQIVLSQPQNQLDQLHLRSRLTG